MSLIESVLSFDGKHVDGLKAAINAANTDVEWDELSSFFTHPEQRYQVASTWLVKAAFEAQKDVPPDSQNALIEALGTFEDWETKLHLLQTVRYLDLNAQQNDQLLEFISACENDHKTLVRVWALDALVRITLKMGAPLASLAAQIEAASKDKAASMRARARNLVKEFPELEKFIQ